MRLYFSPTITSTETDVRLTDNSYLMREVDDIREALYEIGRFFRSNGIKARGVWMRHFTRTYAFGTDEFHKFDDAIYIGVYHNKYWRRFILLTDDVVQKLKDAPKEYIVGETSPSIELLDNYFDDLKRRKA